MYEDEFELTFNLSGEEPQPEQAAQEPPVPPKPEQYALEEREPTERALLKGGDNEMPSHYTIRQAENEATIYLYGDITADGEDAGTSASRFVRQLETLEADTIHVHIDSYGGAVSELSLIHI